MRRSWAFLLLLVLTPTTCTTFEGSLEPRARRELLTSQELTEVDCVCVLEAVQRLRPQWLWAKGPTGLTNAEPDFPQVVLDGMRIGDLSELGRIPIAIVKEIRFLDPGSATVRYGLGFTSGAIVIRTVRG